MLGSVKIWYNTFLLYIRLFSDVLSKINALIIVKFMKD